MDTAEFVAVDWAAVREGMLEYRAEGELAIQQRIAEIRAEGRRETLVDKETVAGWQGCVDLVEAFAADLDEE
jgi:hypothetical protein